jgi:hypothetical protein
MLAEFDEFYWDKWIFVGGCILLIVLYYWNKKRMQAKVEACLDRFPTAYPELELIYWHEENLTPLDSEILMADRIFTSAKKAWPELEKKISENKYVIWFIRSAQQRIGWRQYGGIKWIDVPSVNRIPASNPSTGYGGMREGNVVYVATFIDGRDPEALLVHEFTHAITGIHNDAQGNHPLEFTVEENKLKAELAKV